MKEDYLVVILDNRPMYRAGIKSILEKTVPSCSFIEHYFLSELSTNRFDKSTTYFFIRINQMPNKTIIDNIQKLKFEYETCKIILYDYQQPIENIVNFFHEKIDAYLPDDFGEEELRECFNSLSKNRMYLNTQIAVELLVKTPNIRSRKNFKLVSAM